MGILRASREQLAGLERLGRELVNGASDAELTRERFAGSICDRCHREINDETHYPSELGGGCIPDDDRCPECASKLCEDWCSLARSR